MADNGIPVLAEIVPPGTTAAFSDDVVVAKASADERSRVAQATEVADELVAHGQRRINLIWERTQFIIAISVVESALVVAVGLSLGLAAVSDGTDTDRQIAIVALFGLANLVIGFYFGRTNHQRIGGVSGVGPGQDLGR